MQEARINKKKIVHHDRSTKRRRRKKQHENIDTFSFLSFHFLDRTMFLEHSTTTVEIVESSCESWTGLMYMYGHILPGIALTIFGLTFHPIALYYFAASRNIRRSAYSYYFSAIALVDLLRLILWFGFLVLDYRILKLKFHPYECSIQTFVESVASSISAWLTVSLTVERCLVIFKPLQAFTDRRGKRALIVIVLVILACCAGNSLLLKPGFYEERLDLFDYSRRL